MLLISDGALDDGARLRAALAAFGPCDELALSEIRSARATTDLVISDVALDSAESVALLRGALRRFRDKDIPILCLLRSDSRQAVAQALSVGATATQLRSAEPDQLRALLAQLLGSSSGPQPGLGWLDPQTRAAASVARAQQAVKALFMAATDGLPVQKEALQTGTEAVVDVIADQGLRGWLDQVWEHDSSVYRHSLLVAGISAAFAQHLHFRREDCEKVAAAALLHDIGKARTPLSILNKPGQLTETERAVMQLHPVVGHMILSQQGGFDADILLVVRHHHEYLDGTGYPDRLTATEIPDLVRLVTICDIYASLIEARPYKEAMDGHHALEIMRGMGPRLDNDLLDAFAAAIAGA